MANETDLIVAFIRKRAEQNRKVEGPHKEESVATAADLDALAGDIVAGLHRA